MTEKELDERMRREIRVALGGQKTSKKLKGKNRGKLDEMRARGWIRRNARKVGE